MCAVLGEWGWEHVSKAPMHTSPLRLAGCLQRLVCLQLQAPAVLAKGSGAPALQRGQGGHWRRNRWGWRGGEVGGTEEGPRYPATAAAGACLSLRGRNRGMAAP